MPDHTGELLQGTLELLVLKALSLEPMHGWGLAQRIEQMSRDVFQVSQGSLYPALQRMKRKGWIKSQWRLTENNRRALDRRQVDCLLDRVRVAADRAETIDACFDDGRDERNVGSAASAGIERLVPWNVMRDVAPGSGRSTMLRIFTRVRSSCSSEIVWMSPVTTATGGTTFVLPNALPRADTSFQLASVPATIVAALIPA